MVVQRRWEGRGAKAEWVVGGEESGAQPLHGPGGGRGVVVAVLGGLPCAAAARLRGLMEESAAVLCSGILADRGRGSAGGAMRLAIAEGPAWPLRRGPREGWGALPVVAAPVDFGCSSGAGGSLLGRRLRLHLEHTPHRRPAPLLAGRPPPPEHTIPAASQAGDATEACQGPGSRTHEYARLQAASSCGPLLAGLFQVHPLDQRHRSMADMQFLSTHRTQMRCGSTQPSSTDPSHHETG